MKKNIKYLLLFFVPLLIDRVTKYLILTYDVPQFLGTTFVSCDLVFNRGISWGIFHSSWPPIFWGVTVAIMAVVCAFALYTFSCWRQGRCTGGEFLILSGAVSNIIDRFLYGGVLDFISISWGLWSFPLFNSADVVIWIGICVLIIRGARSTP